MTRKEIKEKYSELLLVYSEEEDILAHKIRQYGLFRIIIFLLWVIMIYLSTSWSWMAFGIIMGVGATAFGYLVRKHGKMHRRKAILEQLVRINREQENAMEWKFDELDDGAAYIDEIHLFSYDLDLFGKGSLFQYVNRTSTIPGRDRLAQLLTNIEMSAQDIRQRQKAVSELSALLDWRQDFRVQGLLTDEQEDDIRGLEEWVISKPDFKSLFFKVLVIFIPLLNLGVFLLSVFAYITFWQFLTYLIIPLMFAGIKHRKVNAKHNLLSRKFQVLKKYSKLFGMIEGQAFSSERMLSLHQDLLSGGNSAGKAIRQLSKIANAFDTRLNLLAGFLMNIFFLWDIRQSVRLESWQKRYRDHLSNWFRVMAETDAYISLAGYAYNNPASIYPDISEGDDFHFKAEKLGHPLIHAGNRVSNDFSVDTWGNFTILTGANMAGKSTFLRTIGVNMVLASAGAPVCAETLSFTPVKLVTSIHTIDSLANNESYFYAELKRLKLIIDMLKEGRQVFIILDEILKGTNSNDKQSGSRALVKQLVSLKASGIIATHDLSLGELEKLFPDNVQNRCFEIIIEKDHLDYDYLLKEGIARNMNATILMERMGITGI